MSIRPSNPPDHPIFIAILSLVLLGGVGQIRLGQTRKGIVIIVGTLIFLPVGVGFIIWITGAIDAYLMADKLKNGEAIKPMQWFWEN